MTTYDQVMKDAWSKAVTFNKRYPVGTKIRIDKKFDDEIKSPAYALPSGEIVVLLSSQSPVAIKRISR